MGKKKPGKTKQKVTAINKRMFTALIKHFLEGLIMCLYQSDTAPYEKIPTFHTSKRHSFHIPSAILTVVECETSAWKEGELFITLSPTGLYVQFFLINTKS